ncbi:MAG: DNA mismatch repair protein MutS, partial [Microbacteriaceae bacterium]|nr:DNA mismatch repair protein MutS [Burkholderiaceae bacterium]
MKASSFQQLKQIQQQLAEQQKLTMAREAARKEAERKASAEKNLFVRAAGAVKPLREQQRVQLAPEQPAPIPFQQQLDEQRVLREAISDEFDASTLLDVDDALSFRRPGIGIDVTGKLRKGQWTFQRELDLHGPRREDAREALPAFARGA